MKRRDALRALAAIDRLDIGPVRVEPRRMIAPYAVSQGGKSESIELIYRFEEDVFDDSEESRNLAAMIAAQVALNYGLFCRKLVFHDALDERDRGFLEEFAENTAREIWVNKLLMPNVFLTGPVTELEPVKLDRYLRAELSFPNRLDGAQRSGWNVDPGRHVVLSSGGKDSLLSFGVLRELGRDVQAVFLNESGRHWYTALNAHRHFQAEIPGTGRVWTNSDRIFAWMLRQLPFVREDFARVRADEYPVRLWTVAVFLFGALPLLRKRGAGRLLIGNEFDTSVRASFRGIQHYGGLYDQSRWFDNAMTRYFRRKGWGVCQFSVLRPLSELLIQKMLVQRYPDLQRLQVSCHAARVVDDRVLPCGDCEKCRRIVGMLTAIDADPAACGYGAEQVESCLRRLAAHGVHQESAGAQQLAHMLVESGKLPEEPGAHFSPRPHPEVLQLRFDPQRSPFETIPRDLREETHRLFLQHATGAVERRGRVWAPCDALGEAALARPYAFERLPAGGGGAERSSSDFLVAEMTWPQARRRFREVDVALLPVGAIEQHGPHLPLDTDAFDADYLARKVAEACSNPRPLVLPLVAYGVSYHHDDFAGTFSVSPETQSRLIYEVGMSAARNGISKLVIINGHGGNGPALHLAAQMINRDAHIFTCVDSGETSDHDVYELVESHNDVHAGEVETSTTLAIRPELVDMSKAPEATPRFSSGYLDFTSKRAIGWYARTSKISSSGVMGDATRASAAKGEKIWDLMIRNLVELVDLLKRLSLDEIYQRRY